MTALTERRKGDREAMALQVAELAGAYGLTAAPKPEQPGTRETSVDIAGPHGTLVRQPSEGQAHD